MSARILVVDDIATNLQLLEARLRAEYYEVALANSGPAALRLAVDWKPDVILLDVMMPGMDGYEVCRLLKARDATAHIPVVMITALVDQSERVRGLEAGADDFLSKPVDHATLFARLRALLRTKQVLDAFRIRSETAEELGLERPEDPPASVAGARAMIATGTPREAAELQEVLARDGVLSSLAADAATAWRCALEEEFDLALLSLSLDGGDGLRLASRLRAHTATRDLPVLLIGDADQKGMVLRGFDLGANDHVLRPVDPNELRARARNQIRRKRYQERVRADLQRSLEAAVTDGLTGLRNRRYATRHLEGLLRAGGATVLLLDVDHFKRVNDTLGHACGDAVLKEVAERLRQHVRAVDVVARYGGEEFLVIMSESTLADMQAVAERLRQAVSREPIRTAEGSLTVTVSIGGATAPAGSQLEKLIARADAALYRAKAGGRDRLEVAEAA
ncbi:PleD family two-component system response regulator [Roseomonas sp. OT10]|uniref:PleD family two-component system response regulator n=1 Tax=Roseomonas cutis TaxID=2897332 RepID=UPI001E3B9064|nr:PleD family two-component system response regulator [Roseomonas sp. OT10]UFN51044.1 PleD family two-component system response regulator [Roseomonas sp. OT10]